MNGNRRVVVTGLGALTPIGLSVDEFWKNLVAGKSGAGPVTYFDSSGYDTHFACELKGFNPTDYLDRKAAQRMDPFAQYAIISADRPSLTRSFLQRTMDPDRIGVVYGSGIGGMKTYDTQFNNYIQGGPGRISPFFIPDADS